MEANFFKEAIKTICFQYYLLAGNYSTCIGTPAQVFDLELGIMLVTSHGVFQPGIPGKPMEFLTPMENLENPWNL